MGTRSDIAKTLAGLLAVAWLVGNGIHAATADDEPKRLVTKPAVAQPIEDTGQTPAFCRDWNRTMTRAYRRADTERQFDRVKTLADTSGCYPDDRYWDAYYPALRRSLAHSRVAWDRKHPNTSTGGDSDGSVTVSSCVGHVVRLCARS